jgi:nucleoside-diphosphate-sugar epimerase
MTRVLVTGATGFIGSTLCETLARSGCVVRAALRMNRIVPDCIAEKIVVGEINSTCDWTAALDAVDAVIHVAARAHVLHAPADLANGYAAANERGTECLAIAAARADVRRFVFLSSVKVNGEETRDRPYTARDEPRPQDAYAISKWHGEKFIGRIAAQSAMEAVVVRSPLGYGPRVRANFLRLLRSVDRGWPLPFGAVHNRRSFVSVWNLCDLLIHVLKHPSAPSRTWMVSDAEDLSIADLIRRIGSAMGRPVRLLPVPVGLLRLSGALVGRSAEITRLCGSLVVDITETRTELGWSPCITVDEALARTIAWYRKEGQALEI